MQYASHSRINCLHQTRAPSSIVVSMFLNGNKRMRKNKHGNESSKKKRFDEMSAIQVQAIFFSIQLLL